MRKFIDLTGQRFGKLVVIERVPDRISPSGHHSVRWRCKCDCTKEKIMDTNTLRNKHIESCGCLTGLNKNDLIGKVFGRLTVIAIANPYVSPKGVRCSMWLCKCECASATEIIVRENQLKSGKTKSCGCLAIEVASKLSKIELGLSTFNAVYRGYKRHAKIREFEFEINKDLFRVLTSLDCYYCGCPPSNCQTSYFNNGDFIYNGIDRIDSSIGYTVENTVPCCGTCNKAKLAMPRDEFYLWIDRVYNFSKEKILNLLLNEKEKI